LFQKDLLPGLTCNILESKQKRESLAGKKAYSWPIKAFSATFIVGVNCAMLFYVYLFCLLQTEENQSAWFKSIGIWLLFEVLFVSTMIVFIGHVLIPALTIGDVKKVRDLLVRYLVLFSLNYTIFLFTYIRHRIKLSAQFMFNNSTVNDYKQLLRFRRSEGKDQFDNESCDPANTDFNSAKYMFVSFRLAERFPDTRESRVISAFSTPFPTVAYGSTRELSVSYNRKFDGFKSSISMILLYFVGSFSALPNPMQVNLFILSAFCTPPLPLPPSGCIILIGHKPNQ